MWKKTYSKVYPGQDAKSVWELATDVNNWSNWHHDLDYCRIEGPFKVGNHFMLKPKGMSAVKIVLTDIQEGKSFTDCTSFFGAKMYDTHGFEETKQGLKLTNTVVVTGPLTWLWVLLVAKNVARSAPEEMDALIKFGLDGKV